MQLRVMSKVKDFKVQLGVCSLCLQSIDDDEARKSRSAECKNVLLTMLQSVALNASEKREITALIVDNPRGEFWNPPDLTALLSAVEKSQGQLMRKSQEFTPHLLEFFLESEWARWTKQGLQGAESIAVELISRIKSIAWRYGFFSEAMVDPLGVLAEVWWQNNSNRVWREA